MAEPAATAGLARLVVSVSDLRRGTDFYTRVIGLGPVSTAGELAVLRTAEGVEVMLHERPTVPSRAAVAVTFLVDDVDTTTAAAEAAGATVVDPPAVQPWGERMSVITDPDGHVVCLVGRAHS